MALIAFLRDCPQVISRGIEVLVLGSQTPKLYPTIEEEKVLLNSSPFFFFHQVLWVFHEESGQA